VQEMAVGNPEPPRVIRIHTDDNVAIVANDLGLAAGSPPGCVPRIGDESGATVTLPTPKPAESISSEELNPGLAPGMPYQRGRVDRDQVSEVTVRVPAHAQIRRPACHCLACALLHSRKRLNRRSCSAGSFGAARIA
jgi:hypothetical protein